MTPKEQAEGLIKKYYVNIPLKCLMLDENLSKKMALIAVNELINDRLNSNILYPSFWKEVKQEIEKL